MIDNQDSMALKNMILTNEMEVLFDDIVDESKEPTFPDVYVEEEVLCEDESKEPTVPDVYVDKDEITWLIELSTISGETFHIFQGIILY